MKSFARHAGDIFLRGSVGLLATVAFASTLYCQAKGTAKAVPVFRSPLVLKLHIDNEHYYEQKFDRVPYVADGEVYLFGGWPTQASFA